MWGFCVQVDIIFRFDSMKFNRNSYYLVYLDKANLIINNLCW